MIDNTNEETLKLLMKLIETRSDSSSKYEIDIENVLIEEIAQMAYFKQHPEHFGKCEMPNDLHGRSVVWGLSYNAKHTKTVILFGHHDAVDLTAYGEVDGLNAQSVLSHLKASCAILPEDTYDGEWLFGRGSCDMKAGIAIHLMQLKRSTESDLGVNILFLSVPDEETQSEGMRYAVHVLDELKVKFDLAYELAILSEPHDRSQEQAFTISTGSVGKMMPVIITKGMPSHSGTAYGGLSAISITMEIIKAIELNTEMGDSVNKKMTPPPAFLNLNTYKDTYDVTTPEFTAAYFNWLYLKGNLTQKFAQLKELCVWSMEDAINQFNYSYNEFLRKQAMPSYEECMEIHFDILFFDELKERVSHLVDVDAVYKTIKEQYSDQPLHEISIRYMQKLISIMNVRHPVVVIGLLPPFYPVVDSRDYYEVNLKATVEKCLEEMDLSLRQDLYFMGISDMSYMKKMSHDPKGVLNLMPEYQKSYQIDFDRMDIEVIHIGPWGKDLHLKTERVYLKDVLETVPRLLDAVFAKIASM